MPCLADRGGRALTYRGCRLEQLRPRLREEAALLHAQPHELSAQRDKARGLLGVAAHRERAADHDLGRPPRVRRGRLQRAQVLVQVLQLDLKVERRYVAGARCSGEPLLAPLELRAAFCADVAHLAPERLRAPLHLGLVVEHVRVREHEHDLDGLRGARLDGVEPALRHGVVVRVGVVAVHVDDEDEEGLRGNEERVGLVVVLLPRKVPHREMQALRRGPRLDVHPDRRVAARPAVRVLEVDSSARAHQGGFVVLRGRNKRGRVRLWSIEWKSEER